MRRRPVIAVSLVAVAAFSLLAAGCGSSPNRAVASLGSSTNTSAASATTTGSSAPGGELAEYAGCMRSHGVPTFPDQPSYGTSNSIKTEKSAINQVTAAEASSPRFESAQRGCSRYAPQGQPPAHVSAQEITKLLAVSHCMRAHGVADFPDPNPTTGDFVTPAGLDKTSPQVLSALRACASLGRAAGLAAPTISP